MTLLGLIAGTVTIRETRPDERGPGIGRWVAVDEDDRWCLSFGILPVTASTRPAMIYWAERWCSNWGAILVRPEGWENVVGKL